MNEFERFMEYINRARVEPDQGFFINEDREVTVFLSKNKQAEYDRIVRSQMEHNLASIMFDVRMGRGFK